MFNVTLTIEISDFEAAAIFLVIVIRRQWLEIEHSIDRIDE
jgi:hypothetical protein